MRLGVSANQCLATVEWPLDDEVTMIQSGFEMPIMTEKIASRFKTGIPRRFLLCGLFFGLALGLPLLAQTESWRLDPNQSEAQFSVRHLGISTVRGTFTKVSGNVAYSASDPAKSSIDVVIDAGSVDTRVEMRDKDLRGPNYLDVAKYPVITFKSTHITAPGAGKLAVTGDLTIHGVTKEVVLDVDGPSAPVTDKKGNMRMGASASTKINRLDFGVGSGPPMVGNELAILIDIEMTKEAPASSLADPSSVAYVSEEEGGISVIDLNTLKVIRRVEPKDVAPRGLAVTADGKYVITSNKNTSDITIFSTPSLDLVKHIHIGESPEFIKINPAGDRLFATFEPSSAGGPPKDKKPEAENEDENGPPAQVASFHIGDWAPGPVSTAGQETEGIEFSHDAKLMLVANESQETIGIFDEASGRHLRDIDLKSYGIRPRGIKISPQGTSYAVTMESSGTLLTMDQNFNVLKSVPTGAKPYGLTYDRAGKRIFVSAAQAHRLQVFSADTLQLLAEIPTGQRCWHFTFTPDDSKVLLACGRSNNVIVIDANSYKPLQTIEGFKLPWGIVTYPRSFGSLGLP